MTDEQIQQLIERGGLPDGDGETELVSTHISWVILTKTHAYKIKKPVHFSFLDFSTLRARKYYCEQELSLNRRLAHDMYLDILPVRAGEQGPVLAKAGGRVIDYALRMRRLDSSRQMHHMLERGAVTAGQVDSLADQMIAFHRSVQVVKDAFDLNSWRSTYNDLAVVLDHAIDWELAETARTIERAIALSDGFLDAYGDRMLERQAEGWVVNGHGDLHARNIFLTDPPAIFDCIEFSEELRHLDVLNEIAFFCMDMDVFERSDLGDRFFRRYTASIRCLDRPEDEYLFQYFKLYRCNVRLKVNGLEAAQSGLNEENRSTIEHYTQLMQLYISNLSHANGRERVV